MELNRFNRGKYMTFMKFLKWILPIVAILLLNACGKNDSTKISLVASGEVESEDLSKTYLYDELGRLVKEDLGDGRYIAYTYDKSGSLIRQTLIRTAKRDAKQ